MSHECFADEIAIDFPSVGRVVERMRDAFLGEEEEVDVLRAEISLSQREAFGGLVVPVTIPVRITCPHCGGRGESWTERCHLCGGSGQSTFRHEVRVSVPPGIADGACVRFRLKTPDSASVRVELRVAIRSSAA
jgi:DnaJ-class molecular chaperone